MGLVVEAGHRLALGHVAHDPDEDRDPSGRRIAHRVHHLIDREGCLSKRGQGYRPGSPGHGRQHVHHAAVDHGGPALRKLPVDGQAHAGEVGDEPGMALPEQGEQPLPVRGSGPGDLELLLGAAGEVARRGKVANHHDHSWHLPPIAP